MSWRVARSLDILLGELNTVAPRRSTASDGSIGDPRHQANWSASDHNPWISLGGLGIVRARDFTHDPAGGLDCNKLAEHLADLIGVHPALGSGAYLIWNERIVSYDRRSEGWRWYGNWSTGRNPHDHHMHVSVATSASGFDSTQPWGWTNQEDDVTPEDIDKIADRVVNRLMRRELNADGSLTVASALRRGIPDEQGLVDDLTAALAEDGGLTRDDVAKVERAVRRVLRQGVASPDGEKAQA